MVKGGGEVDKHLHTASKHLVQDVSASFHECNVSGGRVLVLSVGDGINEAVHEFLSRPQQVRLDEAHHAVV